MKGRSIWPETIERLFDCFDAPLRSAGYLLISGQILDVTLIAAPKQRNTNTGKANLREGRISQVWQDNSAKLSHKERHARWTLKFIKAKRQDDGTIPSTDLAIPFSGYKSHISIDRKFWFIQIVGIIQVTIKIGLANIVYNMRRVLCLERISATAQLSSG